MTDPFKIVLTGVPAVLTGLKTEYVLPEPSLSYTVPRSDLKFTCEETHHDTGAVHRLFKDLAEFDYDSEKIKEALKPIGEVASFGTPPIRVVLMGLADEVVVPKEKLSNDYLVKPPVLSEQLVLFYANGFSFNVVGTAFLSKRFRLASSINQRVKNSRGICSIFVRKKN